MTNPIKTVEIVVTGRVQGVYFRKSAEHYAHSLRLNGFAENLSDGSVKIVAQGPEKNIQEMLTWCHRGSLFAKVEGMSFRWIENSEEYKDFHVVRSGSLFKDQITSFFNLGKRVKEKIVNFNALGLNIPNHIVIIPNGDRTWARERGLKPWEAYWHVLKNIDKLIDGVRDLHVKHLTFWGMSTENWKRDGEEVQQLLKVLEATIDRFEKKLVAEKVRFRHLGRKDRLPKSLVDKLVHLEESTSEFEDRSLNAAIDYGGRDELLRAIDSLIKSGKTNVTEAEFSNMLDTAGIPDPDLIIRTAGEKRLSGMMPWQSVYAEFYSTEVYFPDFNVEHLKEAIIDYSARKRTFGGDVNANALNTAKAT